jgi:hypothetical protein
MPKKTIPTMEDDIESTNFDAPQESLSQQQSWKHSPHMQSGHPHTQSGPPVHFEQHPQPDDFSDMLLSIAKGL